MFKLSSAFVTLCLVSTASARICKRPGDSSTTSVGFYEEISDDACSSNCVCVDYVPSDAEKVNIKVSVLPDGAHCSAENPNVGTLISEFQLSNQGTADQMSGSLDNLLPARYCIVATLSTSKEGFEPGTCGNTDDNDLIIFQASSEVTIASSETKEVRLVMASCAKPFVIEGFAVPEFPTSVVTVSVEFSQASGSILGANDFAKVTFQVQNYNYNIPNAKFTKNKVVVDIDNHGSFGTDNPFHVWSLDTAGTSEEETTSVMNDEDDDKTITSIQEQSVAIDPSSDGMSSHTLTLQVSEYAKKASTATAVIKTFAHDSDESTDMSGSTDSIDFVVNPVGDLDIQIVTLSAVRPKLDKVFDHLNLGDGHYSQETVTKMEVDEFNNYISCPYADLIKDKVGCLARNTGSNLECNVNGYVMPSDGRSEFKLYNEYIPSTIRRSVELDIDPVESDTSSCSKFLFTLSSSSGSVIEPNSPGFSNNGGEYNYDVTLLAEGLYGSATDAPGICKVRVSIITHFDVDNQFDVSGTISAVVSTTRIEDFVVAPTDDGITMTSSWYPLTNVSSVDTAAAAAQQKISLTGSRDPAFHVRQLPDGTWAYRTYSSFSLDSTRSAWFPPICDCSCHTGYTYVCNHYGQGSNLCSSTCSFQGDYCYDGGNNNDGFGCDDQGDEAGPCCPITGATYTVEWSAHAMVKYDRDIVFGYMGSNGCDNFDPTANESSALQREDSCPALSVIEWGSTDKWVDAPICNNDTTKTQAPIKFCAFTGPNSPLYEADDFEISFFYTSDYDDYHKIDFVRGDKYSVSMVNKKTTDNSTTSNTSSPTMFDGPCRQLLLDTDAKQGANQVMEVTITFEGKPPMCDFESTDSDDEEIYAFGAIITATNKGDQNNNNLCSSVKNEADIIDDIKKDSTLMCRYGMSFLSDDSDDKQCNPKPISRRSAPPSSKEPPSQDRRRRSIAKVTGCPEDSPYRCPAENNMPFQIKVEDGRLTVSMDPARLEGHTIQVETDPTGMLPTRSRFIAADFSKYMLPASDWSDALKLRMDQLLINDYLKQNLRPGVTADELVACCGFPVAEAQSVIAAMDSILADEKLQAFKPRVSIAKDPESNEDENENENTNAQTTSTTTSTSTTSEKSDSSLLVVVAVAGILVLVAVIALAIFTVKNNKQSQRVVDMRGIQQSSWQKGGAMESDF